MTKKKKELLDEILNSIFESREDEDSIEHVDMYYSDFVEKITELAS